VAEGVIGVSGVCGSKDMETGWGDWPGLGASPCRVLSRNKFKTNVLANRAIEYTEHQYETRLQIIRLSNYIDML
jgi:hypothetical protein